MELRSEPETFEELETAVHAMIDAEALENAQNAQRVEIVNRLVFIVGTVTDKVQQFMLPKGVDLELYRFLSAMYEALIKYKNISTGEAGEVRLFEVAKEEQNTAFRSAPPRRRLNNAEAILDFLLMRYLPPEIVQDEQRYGDAWRFFIVNFGL